jgi:hypothetical protein
MIRQRQYWPIESDFTRESCRAVAGAALRLNNRSGMRLATKCANARSQPTLPNMEML